MERSTISNGKIHYKWPFSIAMLVYQRVNWLNDHLLVDVSGECSIFVLAKASILGAKAKRPSTDPQDAAPKRSRKSAPAASLGTVAQDIFKEPREKYPNSWSITL